MSLLFHPCPISPSIGWYQHLQSLYHLPLHGLCGDDHKDLEQEARMDLLPYSLLWFSLVSSHKKLGEFTNAKEYEIWHKYDFLISVALVLTFDKIYVESEARQVIAEMSSNGRSTGYFISGMWWWKFWENIGFYGSCYVKGIILMRQKTA